MAKEIQLTQGKVAIVDDEDFEYLNRWKWQYSGGYAISVVYDGRVDGKTKNKNYKMHRVIMNPPKGLVVDHINGSPLDNRRSNLQICTQGLNNAKKRNQSNNTSGYRGVSWITAKGKWKAVFNYQYKKYWLGYHIDIIDAAKAYDEKAKEILGEFAVLNMRSS